MKTTTLLISKKSKRLVIRPLQLQDYENWAQAHSNRLPPQNAWDQANWKSSELTKDKFHKLLKKQKDFRAGDKFYDFGVFDRNDGVLLGQVSLMDISRGIFQNAYLGYIIYNPYWGHGYAQEACSLALKAAFQDLRLHRVEAGIAPSNKRSIRTARALGFRKEGISKRRLNVDGKWQNMAIYALTIEEWKK